MSETPSDDRLSDASSAVRREEAAALGPASGPEGSFRLADDEKTIISNRPPVVPPGELDAQARRALGRFAPGDRIGPYELVEYVGGGGMGRVFRARDTELGRIVALKVLSQDQAADPETLLRFRNEARSAARLDHEGFARVYGVGADDGVPYLVFEFVEGATIRQLVEDRGPLPLADAINYTLQVANALAYAAARGVVHRDVKPSNVLVTHEGRAKVIDLGLARIQNVEQADSDLTASGVTLGTFDYISPEQARDPRSVDVRSDIYSLGCTFFFMLIGRPPFPEGTVLQKLLQHQGDEPPDVRQFRPDLPEEVLPILRKMLAKNPAHRYQTPLELIEPLEELAGYIGLRPVGPGGRIWTAPAAPQVSPLQKHVPWMATVAALLVIFLLLDFLWSTPPAGGPEVAAPSAPAAPAKPSAMSSPTPEAKSEDARSPTVKSAGSSSAAADAPGTPAAGADPSPPGADDLHNPMLWPPGPREPWETLPGESVPLPANGLGSILDAPFEPGGLDPSGVAIVPAGPSAPLPDESLGVLTVGDPRDGTPAYSTLAAALGAAKTGDVIVLRFSGRRVEKKPLALPDAKLVLRAAKGYQPVVVFQPDESDQVKYPRAMFTLGGGQLRLVSVALELDVPRHLPVDRWTFFELSRAESLQLEGCSLTIRNPYPQETSFFRVRMPAGADRFELEPGSLWGAPAQIDMTDCIVRGDAVMVDVDPLQPLRFGWTNGLLSTGQRFLRARGGDKAPPSGETLQIDLKHVTAAVGRGLCLLEGDRQARYQLPVEIHCSDSILVAQADAALVEQLGPYDALADKDFFQWSGDRNFYHGFSVFWSSEDVEMNELREPLSFDAWQARWAPEHEAHSRWERVDFRRLPDATQPAHMHTPADYVLSDAVDSWTHGQASDGTDVGFLPDRLPALPPTPKSEPLPYAAP